MQLTFLITISASCILYLNLLTPSKKFIGGITQYPYA